MGRLSASGKDPRNLKYNVSARMKDAIERLRKQVGDDRFPAEFVDALNKKWQYANELKGVDRFKYKVGEITIQNLDSKKIGRELGRRYIEERRKEVLRLFENFEKDMSAPFVIGNDDLRRKVSSEYFEKVREVMEGIEV